MSLHADLLAQAEHLAKREPQRPRQASLRRAISAAYYALFHLLIDDAAHLFVRDTRLVNCVNRIYAHREMADISKSFAKGELPKAFDFVRGVFTIPQELKDVAQAFVVLQQARHDADYNLSMSFTRSDVVALIARAKQAFADWNTIRKHDLARIYLACFLLWKQWDKPPR